MELRETLKQFCTIFGRNGFDIGEVVFNESETILAVPPQINLNGQLKEFYSLVNFQELTIWGAFYMEIFSLQRIAKMQDGWRWITTRDGTITEDEKNWNKDWIVFGDRNGDAVFAKIDDPSSPVFGSIQKSKNLRLADSVNSFFQILNDCLIIEENEFDFEIETENFEPKQEFLARVKEVLSQHSSADTADTFLNFFFD